MRTFLVGRAGALCLPACLLAGLILTVVALDATASAARSRPKCAGVRATQISSKSRIVPKPHAVVFARGKRDNTIKVAKGDRTRHIICGGSGRDNIEGGRGDEILVGGPGTDRVFSRRGNDLIVGDSYSRTGDATGRTGRDTLYGGRGWEVIVGDNLGAGDATGGSRDRLGGNVGRETIIGDSAVTGSGTASGGADDWVAAMEGGALVIGDSFSPRGDANGGGDDLLNHALNSVLMIGDSATLTGTARGGGNDELHGSTGGDFHKRCRGCHDRLYGDSYALTGDGDEWGRGNDLLTADEADHTYMDGQGSEPGAGHHGRTLCAGHSHGETVATACDVYLRIQQVRRAPEPPPPRWRLKRYGAWWPVLKASPRP